MVATSIRTLADLMKRLGDVPLERIRFHPPPGTAVVADVTRIQENTPGEMNVKRREYFDAGVQLVWEVDPKKRTVAVYTNPTEATILIGDDILDGGAVLPGFRLPLAELFGELDQRG